MQPDRITWNDFTARQAAVEAGDEPEIQPKPAKNKRPEPSLSTLLMQAIHLAGARRGRLSRVERIRERTLLEVLTEAMRR
jgi:hypothetical protein